MDSGFFKSLALAVVLTAALIAVVNLIGDFAVRPKPGFSPKQVAEKPAVEKPVVGKPAKPEKPVAAKAAPENLSERLAGADPQAGRKAFRVCKGCHTDIKGARATIGPNLWGVLGRARGSQEGYKYSKALAGLGGQWSYENLDAFLSDPRAYVKGTKMMFRGIRKAPKRAGVIAYLRSLSDSPKPLP